MSIAKETVLLVVDQWVAAHPSPAAAVAPYFLIVVREEPPTVSPAAVATKVAAVGVEEEEVLLRFTGESFSYHFLNLVVFFTHVAPPIWPPPHSPSFT